MSCPKRSIKLENLVKHKNTFYFKKKLKNRQNLTVSLRTDSKNEALYLVSAIRVLFNQDLEKETIKQTINEYKLKYAYNRTETALKQLNYTKSTPEYDLDKIKQDLSLKENIANKQTETPLKLKDSLEVIPKPNLSLNALKTPLNQFYTKTAAELVEMFRKQKEKEGLKEKSRYEKILDVFLELTNKKYLIDLSAHDFLKFVNNFSDMPNENLAENKEAIRGKNYKEWIEITRDKNLKRVSSKTIKDKLIRINSFLNFCVSLEFLDKNRLNFKIKNEENEVRKNYKIEQIQALFNSKWYQENLENNLKNEPEKVYIPLILLYTGARINEISQLYLNQILEKNGVYYFKIAAEFDNQNIKNLSSRREIPIHKVLIDLGFLEYIKVQKLKQKESENLRVFPNLYYTNGKGFGQNFSKIFNNFKHEFLEKETINKIKSGEILVDLHSFRHTFSTACRAAKIDENDISLLLGHSKNQTQKYGKMPIKILKEKLDKVKYDLNFEELINRIKTHYKAENI